MGKVKYAWWLYVRSMVRQYPERARNYPALKKVETREFLAVLEAIRRTQRKPDGQWRLRLIGLLHWSPVKRTIDGAAAEAYISRRTAIRWSSEFIYEVAAAFGLYEPEEEGHGK